MSATSDQTLSREEQETIARVTSEQGFQTLYLRERERFPNLNRHQVLERAKRVWYQSAL